MLPWLLLFAVAGAAAGWLGGSRTGREPVRPSTSPLPMLGTGYGSPLLDATPPTELRHLIVPWTPHRALVVAITREVATTQPEVMKTLFAVIRAAIAFVDVAVMVPSHWPEAEARVLAHFDSEPRLREHLHFIPSSVSTVWVRDYLPQYGRSRNDRLVLLDSRPVDLTSDPVEMVTLLSELSGPERNVSLQQLRMMMGDDIAPSYLATFLRAQYAENVRLVRPPLALDGGDFLILRDGEVGISESTLRYNGGRDDELRDILRRYYGVKKVHFLATLPGRTIDHLDFILQAVDDGVIVAARPPPLPTGGAARLQSLGLRIQQIMTRNIALLRKNSPGLRIHEIPMPPPVIAEPEDLLNRIRLLAYERLAAEHKIDFEIWKASGPGTPEGAAVAREITARLAERFGDVDLHAARDLDRVSRGLLGRSLAELEQQLFDDSVVYRTYVNATLICTPAGKKAVLIPRYQPRNAAEAATFPEMESQVLAAYRAAVPGAELVWIDCDAIVAQLGAVHCITHLVPLL